MKSELKAVLDQIQIPGHKDNGGHWYPKITLNCCRSIRSPSRAWPWTYYIHCKTYAHKLAYIKARHVDYKTLQWTAEAATQYGLSEDQISEIVASKIGV